MPFDGNDLKRVKDILARGSWFELEDGQLEAIIARLETSEAYINALLHYPDMSEDEGDAWRKAAGKTA